MGTIFRTLFDRLSRVTRAAGAPRVAVGAFGKHPGWDDHAEIAVDTPALVEARRVLYVEGVAGNIDSGAWDRLPEGERLPAFGHQVVWTRRDGVGVGRMWASTDGKGRARYPMVAFADCGDHALAPALAHAPAVLAGIQATCAATESADGVRRAVAAGAMDLKQRLAGGDGVAASRPVELPDLPGGPAAVQGVLYQVVRGLTPDDRLDRPELLGKALAEHPRHLRLPAGAEDPGEAARRWHDLVRPAIGPRLAVLVIQPDGQPWLDLILGTPPPATLFCLGAGLGALPLATDIPYNLDRAFVDAAERYLGSRNPP